MLPDDALGHIFSFAAPDAASALVLRRVSKRAKEAVERAINSPAFFPWRGAGAGVGVLLRLLFQLWTARLCAMPGGSLRANVRALGTEQHAVLFTAAYVATRVTCYSERARLKRTLTDAVHARLAARYDHAEVVRVAEHLFRAMCE